MDERFAREALSRPLVFGDDEQIRAIRFIDALEDALKGIRESEVCEECGGAGQFFRQRVSCCHCSGRGCTKCEKIEACEACAGLGYFVMDWPACRTDVMEAAIVRIKQERREAMQKELASITAMKIKCRATATP